MDDESGPQQSSSRRGYIPAACVRYIEKIQGKANKQPPENNKTDPYARGIHRATWVIAIAGILTFGAAAIQAYIFFNQLGAMRSTDEAIHKQLIVMQGQLDTMEREQQARVVVSDDARTGASFQKGRETDPTGVIFWNTYYTNAGKGEAKNLKIDAYIKVGDGPFKRSTGLAANLFVARYDPGDVKFFSITTPPIYTLEQFTAFKKYDFGIGALVVLSYLDIFDKPHETIVCTGLLASGAIYHANPEECKKQIEK